MFPSEPEDHEPHDQLSWSGWSLEDTLPSVQAITPLEEESRAPSATGKWLKVSSLGVTLSAIFGMISTLVLLFGPESRDDLMPRPRSKPKPKPKPKPRGHRSRGR